MRRTEEWVHAARETRLRDWPGLALRVLLFPIGATVTLAAFFLPEVPFALALLPLLAGLWSGVRTVRFTAMTGFMIWPVFLSAWGLHGLDIGPSGLVWTLAAALVIALGLLAAWIGILPTTLLLTLIPVFPASPLLPLAALLPGLGPPGLFGTLTGLAVIESLRASRLRRVLLALSASGLALWSGGHALIREHVAGPEQGTGWTELPEPVTLTKRGRWIALRDRLPAGASVILGENLFAAEDTEARAFWCHAVTSRGLTLYPGVSERYGTVTRGAVWRLDAETCAEAGRAPTGPVIHRAGLGIPGLTGTWGPMRGPIGEPMKEGLAEPGALRPGPDPDWLICLEAFLPWAWAGLMADAARARGTPDPVIVLSNDSSFRPLPYLPPMPALGHPPVHVLRRKAGVAMAGLAGRTVLFAETGRTVLIRTLNAR